MGRRLVMMVEMVKGLCPLCGGHVGTIVGALGCGGSRIMFSFVFHVHPKQPKYPWTRTRTPTLSLFSRPFSLTLGPSSSCNIATRAFFIKITFNSLNKSYATQNWINIRRNGLNATAWFSQPPTFQKIYSTTIGAYASRGFHQSKQNNSASRKSRYKTTFLPINWKVNFTHFHKNVIISSSCPFLFLSLFT